MSNVIRPRPRLRALPLITSEQIAVRDALAEDDKPACSACADRGVIFFQTAYGPSYRPCPCGGTDADRVELPEFDGAA